MRPWRRPGLAERVRDALARHRVLAIGGTFALGGGTLALAWLALGLLTGPDKAPERPVGSTPDERPFAVPKPDGEGPKEPAASHWNFWPEAVGRPFDPAPFLRPNAEYRLTLDLASVAYRGAGVRTRPAGEDFRKEVGRWLEQGRTEVSMRVLLLYEPEFFELRDHEIKDLEVDLVRMRAAPRAVEGDPFEILRGTAHPPFTFGRVSFVVKTGAAEGPASVALSVWAEDRPVEELAATLCVATDAAGARVRCPATEEGRSLLKGIDPMRVAAEPGGARPDAALHFVEVNPRRVFGVLWRKDFAPDRFVTWPLGRDVTPAKLRDYLADPLMPAFFEAADEANRREVGRDLYNKLFPKASDAPEAGAARRAFEEMMRAHPRIEERLDPKFLAPSIFVRMVLPSLDSPLMMPLGLMAVNGQFVGYSFRIESPLAYQTYAPHAGCVDRWVMVLPPEGDLDRELAAARAAVKPRLAGWPPAYTDMDPVREWLREEKAKDPLALFVTSHHTRNTLYFDRGRRLLPNHVETEFVRPSIAVLNGCGTGELGASEFVAKFGTRGMGAVIATSTQVKGEVAGTFLDCLAQAVETNRGGPVISLAQAYFASVHCLRHAQGKDIAGAYGSRALAYMLLGNSSVRLCPPR